MAPLRPDVSLANALSQVEAVQYRLHMQNLHAPVAEDVASKTLIQDLAQNVNEAIDDPSVRSRLHAADRLPERGQSDGGTVRGAAKRDRHPECARSAEGHADSRATVGEPADFPCRRCRRSAAVAAATKWLVSEWKDLPSAQSIHVDGVVLAFACALVLAAALLAGLLPAISSTGKGALCGAAAFAAERSRQPIAHCSSQDAAHRRDCRDRGPACRRRAFA